MIQSSLLPVIVTAELDAQEQGFDGADLKRIARCDDGHSYAMKRVEDGALIPLAEWVLHHLCRQCAIRTPDFTILHRGKTLAPAFGSRIATYAQIEEDPSSYRVATFFAGHQDSLSSAYTLAAVAIDPDRHGRNFFIDPGRGNRTLRMFDFSRAWLTSGLPFGNTERLRTSRTEHWWRKVFQRMGCKADEKTLSSLQATDAPWLHDVIQSAPQEWRITVDVDATATYWERQRASRIDWARRWLT